MPRPISPHSVKDETGSDNTDRLARQDELQQLLWGVDLFIFWLALRMKLELVKSVGDGSD